jgi:FGGY family of carbohydrate kinases, C-terminal domain
VGAATAIDPTLLPKGFVATIQPRRPGSCITRPLRCGICESLASGTQTSPPREHSARSSRGAHTRSAPPSRPCTPPRPVRGDGPGGDELRVVGGGARSALWLQIKAGVTGRPVRAVQGDHATSAGAAMLAGVAAGVFADLQTAAAHTVRLADEPVLPEAETAEVYEDAYQAYRRLFDGVEQALS